MLGLSWEKKAKFHLDYYLYFSLNFSDHFASL